MRRRAWPLILLLFGAACAPAEKQGPAYDATALPERLSEWGVLSAHDGVLELAPGATPYDLATPLFSDYAQKLRTISLPPGTSASYSANDVFDLPVGTILTKTFYYSASEGGVASGAGRGPLYNARRSVRDSITTLRDGIGKSWLGPVQEELKSLQQAAELPDTGTVEERQRRFEARAAEIRGRSRSIASRSNELGKSTATEMRALSAAVSIAPNQPGFSCFDPTLSQRLRQAADQADQPAAPRLREADFVAVNLESPLYEQPNGIRKSGPVLGVPANCVAGLAAGSACDYGATHAVLDAALPAAGLLLYRDAHYQLVELFPAAAGPRGPAPAAQSAPSPSR